MAQRSETIHELTGHGLTVVVRMDLVSSAGSSLVGELVATVFNPEGDRIWVQREALSGSADAQARTLAKAALQQALRNLQDYDLG